MTSFKLGQDCEDVRPARGSNDDPKMAMAASGPMPGGSYSVQLRVKSILPCPTSGALLASGGGSRPQAPNLDQH